MKELLEKSGQKIINEPGMIKDTLNKVLHQKNSLGAKGYEYVKQFNEDYFRREWSKLIQELN